MRLLTFMFIIAISLNSQTLLKEDFNNLDDWSPLLFEKIDRHSTYDVQDSMLVAKSDASASGIKFDKTYNIYEYPIVSFKWKVSNIYKNGDATSKEGDDYPIRIYIMFKYNPQKAGFFQAIKYDLAKQIYGQYPPHSTVNYIFSNKEQKERIITSPYTNVAKMIVVNSGAKDTNKWFTHTMNILEDYKKAFGELPPKEVTIAIMSDSDNTKESSEAFVDFIEVKSE